MVLALTGDRLTGAFVGEFAALTAAFLWAAATLMFGRLGRQLSPLVLNIVKGLFAIAFILIALGVRRFLSEAVSASSSNLPITATLYLLLSGGIGIGLGDTAYFAAINALGARRALLLETLAPPMTTVLAWVFLSEQLPVMAISGIILTLSGVAWVISERVPAGTGFALANQERANQEWANQERANQKWGQSKWWKPGLNVALLAVFCQASGAVLSRAALLDVAVDPLWSTLIRLSAGMAFMVGIAVLQPWRLGDYRITGILPVTRANPFSSQPACDRGGWQIRWQKSWAALKTPNLLAFVALAAFLATYLGIWLQQIALKYTAAGIAQALLATSPLFVLPMAALLGDRISWRTAIGVAIALGGVWLLLS